MPDHIADIFEQARLHAECYRAGLKAADETGPSARRLRQLLNRLDHVVAVWDADQPMAAYAELVSAMRDGRK